MPRCLTAIPVFNERSYVRSVIAEVRKCVADVLVVDDGSTDGTRDILNEVSAIEKVFHSENRGYGQALISAFDFAIRKDYDWVITIDCDEQHEPTFIPNFLEAIQADDADIFSGSRYLRHYEGNGQAPADRRRINQAITEILNQLPGLHLTDAFCGFKAYRTAGLKKLTLDIPGYAMPLQLWVQAVHHGLRVREIPVRLIYKDPNRHFGGMLDNPEARLAHYLKVLSNEFARTQLSVSGAVSDRMDSLVCK